eukprot:m.204173 g.204173  ORF g.204173 m.204173 type:complete len:1153 (-) comp32880_c2_seq2:143-3601(-)
MATPRERLDAVFALIPGVQAAEKRGELGRALRGYRDLVECLKLVLPYYANDVKVTTLLQAQAVEFYKKTKSIEATLNTQTSPSPPPSEHPPSLDSFVLIDETDDVYKNPTEPRPADISMDAISMDDTGHPIAVAVNNLDSTCTWAVDNRVCVLHRVGSENYCVNHLCPTPGCIKGKSSKSSRCIACASNRTFQPSPVRPPFSSSSSSSALTTSHVQPQQHHQPHQPHQPPQIPHRHESLVNLGQSRSTSLSVPASSDGADSARNRSSSVVSAMTAPFDPPPVVGPVSSKPLAGYGNVQRRRDQCGQCYKRFQSTALFSLGRDPKFGCLICKRLLCSKCIVTEDAGEWYVGSEFVQGHACIQCVRSTIVQLNSTLHSYKKRFETNQKMVSLDRNQRMQLQQRLHENTALLQHERNMVASEKTKRANLEKERQRDQLQQETMSANTGRMVEMGYDEFEAKIALAKYDCDIEKAREYLHEMRQAKVNSQEEGSHASVKIRNEKFSRYSVVGPVEGANPSLFYANDTESVDSDPLASRVLVCKVDGSKSGEVLKYCDALNAISVTSGKNVPGIPSCEAMCTKPDAIYLIYPLAEWPSVCTLDEFVSKQMLGNVAFSEEERRSLDFEIVEIVQQVFFGVGLFHSANFIVKPRSSMDILTLESQSGRLNAVLLPTFGRDKLPDDVSPPEAHDDSHWTSAGDIWALGAILYALVFNKPAVLTPGDEYVKGGSVEGGNTASRPAIVNHQIRMGCRELLESSLLQKSPAMRPAAHTVTNHWLFHNSTQILQEAGAMVPLDKKKKALAFTVELLRKSSTQRVYLKISRNLLVDSVCTQILNVSADKLAGKLSVSFEGELGIDAGGLTTELYEQFFKALFTTTSGDTEGLFCTSSDAGLEAVYLPTPPAHDNSAEIEVHRARLYEAVGRLLVKAIFDGISVPVRLAPSVFKYFLDQEPTLADLELFDPLMARSLRELLMLENASDYGFDFEEFGDGDREVSNYNRQEYVNKKVTQVLFEDRQLALLAMKKGFESLGIHPQLQIFSAIELANLLQGNQHVDAEQVINILQFEGYDSAIPDAVKSFLTTLPSEGLKRFLCFVTAHGCVPKPPLVIRNTSRDDTKFPVAHTCFNRLDLPEYSDISLVPIRLQYVIDHLEAAGFGLA